MTILLTPFMSCSAKLPIYSLFAAAFFPDYAGLVMVLLYFGGIVVGVLAALLLKGQLGDFKKMLDANEVGGTALLGISKPVVKAHGSASEVGICNAVRQAMEVARSGIIDDIAQNIDKMRIEQKAE